MPPTPSSSVLGEAHVARRRRTGASVIQRADRAVLGPVGVEQEERHAADVDAPDLRDDLAAPTGTVTVIGSPSSPVTSAAGRRSGSVVDPVLVLPAGGVDALAEVALAVQQADGDERQRAVGGLLEDVAGERAEAAGVDRQRARGCRTRRRRSDRALGAGGAGRLRGSRRVGADARPPAPARARAAPRRPRRARARRGGASVSSRTGFSPHSSQRCGSIGAKARPRRRASTTSASCTRPRQRVQRRGHARGKGLRGAVDVLAAGQHGRA